MTLNEILEKHPAPWNYTTLGSQVILTDGAGKEVPLFTMLDALKIITEHIARTS